MTDVFSTAIAETQQGQRRVAEFGVQSHDGELPRGADSETSPSVTRSDSERATIERIMKTNIVRYWRDPEMQERYRQLLEAKEGFGGEGSTSGALAAMRSPSEWNADGNNPSAYPRYAGLVRDVNDILGAVDEGTRDALGASFAELPHTVHAATFAALCDRKTINVLPLPEPAMKSVCQVPAYRSLAMEWGQDAPRKMAVLQERIWRVIDRLDATNTQRAIHWFDNLDTPSMMAIGRKLTR